jgi:glycine/D-amino acid oxidase-like deaminating enzyme
VPDDRAISFWMQDHGEPGGVTPYPSLPGDLDVDVAIVGAGFTGLWTAYYLACAAPALQIAVLERDVVGYGASGRNGGWCSGLFAASHTRLDREHGREAMHAMRRAMNETVDEVGRVAEAEGIECSFRKSGTLVAARSDAQLAALRAELEEERRLGIPEEDRRWCEPDESRHLIATTESRGALFTPHCAAIHPGRLVRGLAVAAQSRGVAIHEGADVVEILPRVGRQSRPAVFTRTARVRAETVVLATEGYTSRLPGHRRDVVPIYSLMVATEPLGRERVASLGAALAAGTTFTDGRHLLIYGQVTADGRLAFGGRGAPYHFASTIEPGHDQAPKVHDGLRATITELFPQLGAFEITHRWGGPLSIHRDWFPSVALDRSSGIARAGGYVGDGVATTNLAGRTLRDLVLERESELVRLPWVGHASPRWEPEPFRWLGINAGLRATQLADRLEGRSGRPSRLGSALSRMTGH